MPVDVDAYLYIDTLRIQMYLYTHSIITQVEVSLDFTNLLARRSS